MLTDRKKTVETITANARLRRQIVPEYRALLRTLFGNGDWFVTITFRDRYQDSYPESTRTSQNDIKTSHSNENVRKQFKDNVKQCIRDPRLDSWEPDSKYRCEPGPPVRDAAMREIEHWLLELGFEAAGRKRQEIFDRLANGLDGIDRRNFARRLCRRCLCCEVYNDPVCTAFYHEIHKVATAAIGWVIAEEFGRAGGRWHVHLIVRGAQHVRRKKWWKRAFVRFGRTRIEPIQ